MRRVEFCIPWNVLVLGIVLGVFATIALRDVFSKARIDLNLAIKDAGNSASREGNARVRAKERSQALELDKVRRELDNERMILPQAAPKNVEGGAP